MAKTATNDILKYLKSVLGKDNSLALPPTEYLPFIIYTLDGPQKKINIVNSSRLTEYLGFSPDEISAWDSDYYKLIFKDDLEMVSAEIGKFASLDDDDDHSYECRLNHREGDWRYFRTRGSVLTRDDAGAAKSWVFIAEDITSKTKSEEDVAALRTLVDDTEDLLLFGSWSWDLVIDKMYWTNGVFKLFGYDKADVEPIISSEFYFKHIYSEDQQPVKQAIRSAIEANGEFDIKYNIITKDKLEKIVSTKGKTLADANGVVVKAVGITRDITKQTLINRDLLHYKEMIHEKEVFLNQGSWEMDLAHDNITWSPGMYNLFGYPSDNVPQQTPVTTNVLASHITPEDAGRYQEEWSDILANKDNFISEYTVNDANGSTKKLETYGKVIRNHNRQATKVIATTRDVSRLREYEKSLEEKIGELNQHNTELEDFAYIASHDLQQPLRKLTTFSERLRTKFSDALGSEGTLYLERIAAATDNMRALIENLLEFSRTARSGKHFVDSNVSQLLNEVLAELEFRIEETGTMITSDPLPNMEVISVQIKQLFDNLISNSIKFKRDGEACIIHISCSELPASEKAGLFLSDARRYYKIEIADNGIGFEKEYSERIFQIFQRLHGKSQYPGSGIGLAICKKIVENHNGVIFARGFPGTGAVFTIILPETQS